MRLHLFPEIVELALEFPLHDLQVPLLRVQLLILGQHRWELGDLLLRFLQLPDVLLNLLRQLGILISEFPYDLIELRSYHELVVLDFLLLELLLLKKVCLEQVAHLPLRFQRVFRGLVHLLGLSTGALERIDNMADRIVA